MSTTKWIIQQQLHVGYEGKSDHIAGRGLGLLYGQSRHKDKLSVHCFWN